MNKTAWVRLPHPFYLTHLKQVGYDYCHYQTKLL